ncbi:MAG: NAD(P)(+) transhydrogenase (Re/Si-specific) subunit alpha, partial [Steroidobacteraceae bacterium]
MPLTVGVLKEALKGETRVALTPEITARLGKLGVTVVLEHGAGAGSQIPDADYGDVQFADAKDVLTRAGLLL